MRHLVHVASIVALLARICFPNPSFAKDQPLFPKRLIFSGNETERCLKCHGMRNFAFRDLVMESGRISADRITDLTVSVDTFKLSIHGTVSCQQCHENIKDYPHTFAGTRTRVTCNASCHAVDRAGKPYDHAQVYSQFASSAHKQGLTDPSSGSPRCESCHGDGNPHNIRRAKNALSKSERVNLCIPCHENRELMIARHVDPEAVGSYEQSFHYKAIRFGQSTTAACQDCHTVHAILPADSAASSISTTHIASTCGQDNCHPGVNMNFAMSGANHLRFRIEKTMVLFLEEKLFIVLTLGTMAMLVIGIILDIQKKFGWLRLLTGAGRATGAKSSAIAARLKNFGSRALVLTKKLLID